MSNRGRQNVASFLTKDCKIDWRLGAEFFESHLIDYEVRVSLPVSVAKIPSLMDCSDRCSRPTTGVTGSMSPVSATTRARLGSSTRSNRETT